MDIISTIGDSIIQHGKFNDRIYLMKLAKNNSVPDLIFKLNRIALKRKYTKIFAKVPEYAKELFIDNDYITEACIPKFYNGKEDAYFMAKYFDPSRQDDNRIGEINKILEYAKTKKEDKDINIPGFEFGICEESHIYQMANIYKKVFETYPFPIFDPEYIRKTIKENFVYFSIYNQEKEIIALSSSEMDIDCQNVEMTDFATLPGYQRKGFAIYLLQKMENLMKEKNMKTVYTISRSLSYGMNIVFAKMGYKYGGLLLNNTNICGNFESMNVWYKYL